MSSKKNMNKVIVLTYAIVQVFLTQQIVHAKTDEEKATSAKRLFTQASIAISEDKFADANAKIEKLIRDFSGDHQINIYVSLWRKFFYLQDEKFRKGSPPDSEEIRGRIEKIKAIKDKDLLDLVKLISLGGDDREQYCEELLKRFPDSIWKDWAEWELFATSTVRLAREKYLDKSYQESHDLTMRDLYIGGKKFIEEHPNSYMLPLALNATADWGRSADKAEAIRMYQKILSDYPTADYYCASARRALRYVQGDDYEETEGCSEERDRIITRFYYNKAEPHAFKKNVEKYLQMRNKDKSKVLRSITEKSE